QKDEFQAGPKVSKALFLRFRAFLQKSEIISTGTLEHVRFAGLELDDLTVLVLHKQEGEFIEIRQIRAARILLPEILVALQHQTLAWYIFLQPERSHAGNLLRLCGGTPRLSQLPIAISLFKGVFGQHRESVEHSLARAIRLVQIELDRVRIDLSN